MRLPRLGLLAVAVLPLVSAQSSSTGPSGASNSPSPQVTVITSVATTVGFSAGPSGRVEITSAITTLITSTIQPAAPPPSSTGDSNNSGSSSAQSSTSSANLPTGTVSLVTDQAPSPGATGGSYGPDDNYINAARSLQRNTLLLGVLTAVVGYLVL